MPKLSELHKYFKSPAQGKDVSLGDLRTDSREVRPQDVFVAIKGVHVNGADYVLKAQEQGASAIVLGQGNTLEPKVSQSLTIPVFKLEKQRTLSSFSSWFYDDPSTKVCVIGVTGTNGKTTITQLIAQWLTLMGKKTGLLGTLGWGFLPNLHKSANTTMDAVSLQRALAELVKEGAAYVVMEVSSIGVCEGRVDDVRFYAGGFTNLTRDHLDYHGDMQHYAEAKERFMSMVPPSSLCINGDNEEGIKCIHQFQQCCVYSKSRSIAELLSMSQGTSFVEIKKVTYERAGLTIELSTHRGEGVARLKLLGGFNVENFACALSIMLCLNFPLQSLLSYCEQLKPIRGRMECFSAEHKPQIVVDYAHTPDGVQQVLLAAREHHEQGQLWCVLGCGGDRDHGKRPQMAMKASVYADQVILTSDNPRSEDPKAIIDDMLIGVRQADNVQVEPDRRKAIELAYHQAKEGDVIVIAGKGHEDYQILKDRTIHFSDREIACELQGVECD
ncbi:MAG: UDP-N-acetylmuramoyl-L-alanyl-D-glutamate--2,6-diaminopimelate ligase [Succinivibrio sp.]|nr:UDP-N-acetylmuramoyl-L-alanyl-D-glutamate--2,6-diaminopimelate ligase [Succinivibrio sp.]